MEKHSRDRDYSLILQKIEEQLLQDHIAPFTDVLKKISIYPSELLRGVQCPSCHRFTMQRIYAGWHCPSCNGKFKSAHEPMIKCAPQSKTGDALTILDTFFTNRCLLNHGSRQSSRFSQFFLF